MKLIILRGVSGSGKTTLVKNIALKEEMSLLEGHIEYVVCSADHWFYNDNNEYVFDAKQLGQAHKHCRVSCRESMKTSVPLIFVDNTNTTWSEFKDYVDYAKKYGYDVFLAEPKTSWKFNIDELMMKSTHNVPRESLQKMLDRWQNSDKIIADHPEINYYE